MAGFLRRRLMMVLIGLLLSVSPSVFAHRPGESSADFRWEHGRLEVTAVFSLQLATMILDDPEVSMIGSFNFEEIRERLGEQLSKAFVVEISGQISRPAKTVVTLAPAGEIVCALVHPPMSRSVLSVQAAYLERGPDDAFCWVRVWRDGDNIQAQKLLTRGSPRAEFPGQVARQSPAPVGKLRFNREQHASQRAARIFRLAADDPYAL